MYSIELLAERLQLRKKGTAAGGTVNYYCPFCEDKRGKLNIDYKNNVWRCNRCSAGGGVVDLARYALNTNKEEAIKFLRDYKLYENNVYHNTNFGRHEEYIAKPEVLNFTYRKLLDFLFLNKKDADDLVRRGLNFKAINYYGFKSLPENNNSQIPAKLIAAGCTLNGVPGFYKKDGIWRINAFPHGYLIPYYNVDGLLTGFQVRNRCPSDKYGKYMSFASSGKENGTKSKIPAHLVGYKGQKAVYLTEGALKADIANYFTLKKGKEKAFLAIPGVNNTGSLELAFTKLKEMGVEIIVDTFDMDKIGHGSIPKNDNVAEAVSKIKKIAEHHSFKWKTLTWTKGKGIDDFLSKR